MIPHSCPRCNSHSHYKFGKNNFGNQKYQCQICNHQLLRLIKNPIAIINIIFALLAVKVHFFIMTTMIIQIIIMLTRNASTFTLHYLFFEIPSPQHYSANKRQKKFSRVICHALYHNSYRVKAKKLPPLNTVQTLKKKASKSSMLIRSH
ncbi:IS1/IS1595 family N-terminal zinc-binding domain-containing protein [Ructibacterium gallinarum]